MQDEEVIIETHRIRREIAAEFDDDVHLFFEYLRTREAQRGSEVVTLDRVAPESPVRHAK